MRDHEGDVGRLAQALEAAGAVVRRIGDERWTAPTPCPEWTVRGLVDHLVGGNQLFARVLRGESFESAAAAVRDAATDRSGDDPVAAYDASVRDVVGAFSAPGALERVVRVPFGTVPGAVALHLRITEALVHGWDLATATGAPFDPPAELVEQELAFSAPKLAEVPPERRVFAPPQPVGAGAPPIDRLVALLGRSLAGT